MTRRWLTILLATLAPCIALAAAPEAELAFDEVDSLLVPGEGAIRGLAWIGPDTLVVLDETREAESLTGRRTVHIVMYDAGGNELAREDFSGVLTRGMAWDGEFLWSCGDADDGSSIIYRVAADTMAVQDAFNTAGHRPTAICYDGRFLWISDRDTGRIDRFDPEVDEITRSALTPGFSPCGVAWDGRNMWVADSGTGRLYRLSGSRRRWSGTVDPESFLWPDRDVLLAHDGTSLWYLLDGERTLRRTRFR